MSAPQTDVERQERRHKPSLFGIRGAMIFGGLMIVLLIVYNVMNAGDGEAVLNDVETNAEGSTVATDTYEPGTNNSGTPTDPAATE
ncbi:hypothetical protein ABMC89_05835 [Sulfitobacter sp. HNIBRBA3233]|uniref:hypothetical protein n=1 Tax=Sulfitobacter marinivivus TaxID=3158558 RepID=UPI0032DF5663